MALNTDSLHDLIWRLKESLESANKALPKPEVDIPHQSGISLLDVKSELFLSYLQNLAFLILLKLRNGFDQPIDNESTVREEAVKKLVELRVYLEKGIRPLESRLKYQLDKVVRAADTAERDDLQNSIKRPTPAKERNDATSSDASDADMDPNSDVSSNASIDDLSYRPNPGAFTNATSPAATARPSKSTGGVEVYRPPRITPTAIPTTSNPDDKARRARKPLRSNAIDDYLSHEVSTAPVAEPSIGSTIISGGRTSKSAREMKEEAQRTAYEEANFVRLAPMSKKDKAKRSGWRESGFGGEELRGLGEGLDRIERMTKKRREGRATEDRPRGEGFESLERAVKKRRLGGKR